MHCFNILKPMNLLSGLVGSVLPDLELVDENGCPTMMGQVLHAVVLVALVWVAKNYLRKRKLCWYVIKLFLI